MSPEREDTHTMRDLTEALAALAGAAAFVAAMVAGLWMLAGGSL